MYKQSLELAFQFKGFVIMVAVMELGLQIFSELFSLNSGMWVARFFIYSMLAYLVFSEMIIGSDHRIRTFRKDWRGFAWRGAIVSGTIFFPAFIVSIAGILWLFGTVINDTVVLTIFVVWHAVFIIFTPLILPLIGTVLPAYLKQEKVGLANAYHCGKKQYLKIFVQILTGPMLVHLVANTILLFALVAVPGELIKTVTELNMPLMGAIFVVGLLTVFELVMIVWILATAFLASLVEPVLNSEGSENAQT